MGRAASCWGEPLWNTGGTLNLFWLIFLYICLKGKFCHIAMVQERALWLGTIYSVFGWLLSNLYVCIHRLYDGSLCCQRRNQMTIVILFSFVHFWICLYYCIELMECVWWKWKKIGVSQKFWFVVYIASPNTLRVGTTGLLTFPNKLFYLTFSPLYIGTAWWFDTTWPLMPLASGSTNTIDSNSFPQVISGHS